MVFGATPRSASVVTRTRPALVAVPDRRRDEGDEGDDDGNRLALGHDPQLAMALPDGSDADATIRALVVAHEQERRRIARDLHDVVGQALTVVKLNLETLRRDPLAHTLDVDLRRSIAIVDQAIRDVRDVAIDLRPSILDDLGLVAAVRWYLARQGRIVGYRTSFAADQLPLRLDDEVESACFRVLQEALTNVARHARASRVRVELRQTSHEILLVVEDDGVGFDAGRERRQANVRPTLGLVGMSERASSIGGSFEITSAARRGTTVRARFPRASGMIPAASGAR